MAFIQVGDLVRIYYEEQYFDEGTVTTVTEDIVTVDFYDWIEEWREQDFVLRELFYEGEEVLVPVQRGVVVVDFRCP